MNNGCGVSSLTLLGLESLCTTRGLHPEALLKAMESVGCKKMQYVPLRGHNPENLKSSGISDYIVTMGRPFERLLGVVFSGRDALKNNLYLHKHHPNIIPIDLFPGGAIEIADCLLWGLYDTTGARMQPQKRGIDDLPLLGEVQFVADNYHLRDFTPMGRKNVMKGLLPTQQQVGEVMERLSNLNPDIAAIHIQERNPEEIKRFLDNEPCLLDFELEMMKQLCDVTKIPVIVELDPVPYMPLSLFPRYTDPSQLSQEKRYNIIKSFVAKVNEKLS